MRTETPEEIICRIKAARDERDGGALAFDGDGTLWSGDVGDDFFRGFLAQERIETPAAYGMRALARAFGMEDRGSISALAHDLFEAYLAGRVPEERVYEWVTCACAGWARDEVLALARATVEHDALGSRVQRESARVLAWARSAGIEVFVVSASPRVIVEEAARTLGVDEAHVLAATPLYDGRVMRAAVDLPIPYGVGKVTRLRERLGGRPLYAAFGDNAFDIPLLSAALISVAVRPKPRLVERAHEVAGLVELARA